ncbi:MAG: transporter substrate-binding domain-containing protein, partial [Pseudobdellovibrionaceae bacterium]|nr:transporter substrate-binding domain-containing protein [Pseudobdellovibrionaceae bacterium]
VIASWPRIKSMAKKGGLDLILPVNQLETKELGIQRTQQSVGSSEAAYFVHKDSSWAFQGIESLKSQMIGTIQGYTYPAPLSTLLADPQHKKMQIILASDQGNQRQIKMLASARVSVVPSERLVFWYMAHTLLLAHNFKEAGVLEMPRDLAQFYIGVAAKQQPLAQDLLKWLDQGLEDIKRNRKLDDILKSYGLGPS